MSNKPDQGKKAVGADLIIPVVASVYAVYYMASVWDFPPEAQRSGIFMAGMLLVLSALFFLRVAVQAMRHEVRWDFTSVLGPSHERAQRLAFFGLILIYLLVVRWGGFTLTTFAFLLFGSVLAGLRPWRKAFIFALSASLAGWLFFIVMLKTRFPRGPFENLVSWLVSPWT